MLVWYKVIIMFMQISGMTNTADFFPGVVFSLKSNESSNKYISAYVPLLPIAASCDGNLLHVKCKYASLKYEIFKYPVWSSFTVTGKCIAFNTFRCIIFNIAMVFII